MTPSGWHDDARGRSPGHDLMQIEVWRWAKDNLARLAGYLPEKYGNGEAIVWTPTAVHVEFPFRRGRPGQEFVAAFCDVVALFDSPNLQGAVILEIKPKIDSIGAVIRQCRACYLAAPTDWAVRSLPVVPKDDERFSLLAEVVPVIGWPA